MCTQTMTSTTRILSIALTSATGKHQFRRTAVGPVILPTGSCVRCSWPWPLEWQDRTESDKIAQREELYALRFTWRCTARGRTPGLAKPLRLEIEACAGRHSLRLLVHFEWIGCHWALCGRAAVCGAERASSVGRVEESPGVEQIPRGGACSRGGGAPPEPHRFPCAPRTKVRLEQRVEGVEGEWAWSGVQVSSFSLMGFVEKEGKETVADTDHLAPRIDEPQARREVDHVWRETPVGGGAEEVRCKEEERAAASGQRDQEQQKKNKISSAVNTNCCPTGIARTTLILVAVCAFLPLVRMYTLGVLWVYMVLPGETRRPTCEDTDYRVG
ncbi:hypothetical protein B0H13DRAFT_2292682 [Mycena leptocephala]|nr:hypothetical protein B0H13DRAFT_2292682 [Mycena leptocephala]